MNLDELNDALSASDPDPAAVRGLLERKRQRGHQRMQRMLAASGGLAVVVVLIVGVGLLGRGPSPSSSSSSGASTAGGNAAAQPAATSGSPAASGARNAPAVAEPSRGGAATSPKGQSAGPGDSASPGPNCVILPLKDTVANALRRGASVIVATGTLTGKPVTGNAASAAGTAALYPIKLTSVQTLRGPAIASGSTAWVPGPAPGTAGNVTSTLLAPGGRLFAIVSPRAATPGLVGPTLRVAPIVGTDVVFTPSGCWDVTALQPSQYQAKTQLRPVPSGKPVGWAGQPAENGLYAVPLAAVERVAAQA
jgi:hypothetical protein